MNLMSLENEKRSTASILSSGSGESLMLRDNELNGERCTVL